jgi:polyhydroxyalkanoate synthesis repressor PhaR
VTEPHLQEPAAEGRVVKRYPNRKLYDTTDSRYVTLQQIAEFVRQGEDVRIIDNKTKEDLTEVTLAQILYEEQKQEGLAQPAGTLRSLIQKSGERLMTSLRDTRMGRLVQRNEERKGQERKLETEQAMAELRAIKAEIDKLQARVQVLEAELAKAGSKEHTK